MQLVALGIALPITLPDHTIETGISSTAPTQKGLSSIPRIPILLYVCITFYLRPLCELVTVPLAHDAKYATIRHRDVIANQVSLKQHLINVNSTLRMYFPICLGRNNVTAKGMRRYIPARKMTRNERPIIMAIRRRALDSITGKMDQSIAREPIMQNISSRRLQMETGGASSDRFCDPQTAQKAASCGL